MFNESLCWFIDVSRGALASTLDTPTSVAEQNDSWSLSATRIAWSKGEQANFFSIEKFFYQKVSAENVFDQKFSSKNKSSKQIGANKIFGCNFVRPKTKSVENFLAEKDAAGIQKKLIQPKKYSAENVLGRKVFRPKKAGCFASSSTGFFARPLARSPIRWYAYEFRTRTKFVRGH